MNKEEKPDRKILIKKFFDEYGFVESDIRSFNNFIEKELNRIIEENKVIEPMIIPQNIDDFKIRLDKIEVDKPVIVEADGSKRDLYPIEARIRKTSYSAPVFMEVSAHINGIQRESFKVQVGNLPIMLKSNNCHLHGLSRKELIEKGEDPYDPGGYFIINGSEKILVDIEDLASNNFLVTEASTGPSKYIGKLFSEKGSFKIPHTIEMMKDGIIYLSFTRVKRIPYVIIAKALGLTKEEEIMRFSSSKEVSDKVPMNLLEFANVKTQEDALDFVAKKVGITQPREVRIERIKEIIDKYLLPHIGVSKDDRVFKAYNICKMVNKYINTVEGRIRTGDKDHYMNKRLKLSSELLSDLFRVNLKVLIGDMLYNFQRIVKRGKFPSIRVIIRDKLLTSRIYSSMATGTWVGGRKGISQRIQRLNFLEVLSHLQRVVSPLSTTQENFEARELHGTTLGRLCPIETPEGTNIGLRKNLALMSVLSEDSDESELMKQLARLGVELVKSPQKGA